MNHSEKYKAELDKLNQMLKEMSQEIGVKPTVKHKRAGKPAKFINDYLETPPKTEIKSDIVRNYDSKKKKWSFGILYNYAAGEVTVMHRKYKGVEVIEFHDEYQHSIQGQARMQRTEVLNVKKLSVEEFSRIFKEVRKNLNFFKGATLKNVRNEFFRVLARPY